MFMDKFLALVSMAILVEAIISYAQEIKTIKSYSEPNPNSSARENIFCSISVYSLILSS